MTAPVCASTRRARVSAFRRSRLSCPRRSGNQSFPVRGHRSSGVIDPVAPDSERVRPTLYDHCTAASSRLGRCDRGSPTSRRPDPATVMIYRIWLPSVVKGRVPACRSCVGALRRQGDCAGRRLRCASALCGALAFPALAALWAQSVRRMLGASTPVSGHLVLFGGCDAPKTPCRCGHRRERHSAAGARARRGPLTTLTRWTSGP
jgi:hypothetical protein